ncbi:hypothetical protein BDV27DRAFT_119385 [Aspergillus caelatus]|uniref:Uncharacterized protein n=1 Tax=Aspergillus caelatus TaxID=61420 RepID=A0A5N7ALF6_9EURO|nr:uncharacterized protein BDV27DRAFT_119385 [Aspergillus caelatus]KAE8370744.1 hypothetical protein BDV27DRAFT_119385 [Aspergillus caelatus]
MQHRAVSVQFQRYLRDYLFGNSNINSPPGTKTEAAFQSYIARICECGFTLRIPRCTILLSRDPQPSRSCHPIRLQCGVDFTGSIINQTEVPSPTLIIYDGNFISLGSQDHDLDDIMNGLVLPFAITEMNKKVQSINIPALLSPWGPELPMFHVVIRKHHLLIYSALSRISRSIPTSFNNWPTGIFIGVDTALLTVAQNLVSEHVELDQDSFSLLGILSAESRISIEPLSNIKIKGDEPETVITVLSADAIVKLTLHMPWPIPNLILGFRFCGIADISLHVAHSNGCLSMNISLDNLEINQHLIGIPEWANSLIYGWISHLEARLYFMLTNLVLRQLHISRLPPVHVTDVEGLSVFIQPEALKVVQLSPSAEPFIMASGLPLILRR